MRIPAARPPAGRRLARAPSPLPFSPAPSPPPPPRRADPWRRPRLEEAAAASFPQPLPGVTSFIRGPRPARFASTRVKNRHFPLPWVWEGALTRSAPKGERPRAWEPRVRATGPAEDSAEGDIRPPRPPGPAVSGEQATGGDWLPLAAVKGCLELVPHLGAPLSLVSCGRNGIEPAGGGGWGAVCDFIPV